MRHYVLALASGAIFTGVTTAWADTPGAPFSNLQPSLALTEVTPIGTGGAFPTTTGPVGDTDGFVYNFAGNYIPSGTALLNGQTPAFSPNNTAEFSLMGITYGGNGTSTFGLPNLVGQATIGAGTGAGLPTQTQGAATGTATVSLTVPQLPAPAGSGASFNNIQPSLPLVPLINVGGTFPEQSGGTSAPATFLGQIAWYAGVVGSSNIPQGWAIANGATMPITGNTALFSILGINYGGNGTTNFGLPNLLGRVAVGAPSSGNVGRTFGEASTVLQSNQVPPGNTTVNNDQPSLDVEYLIATAGLFPTSGGTSGGFSQTLPTLGEVVAFAGNYAPQGWAIADGSLLLITQYSALYQILGTQYGGDGVTTFALPNLKGRTIVGSDLSSIMPGFTEGTDSTLLTTANIPTASTPEPASLGLLMAGCAGLIAGNRRTQTPRRKRALHA